MHLISATSLGRAGGLRHRCARLAAAALAASTMALLAACGTAGVPTFAWTSATPSNTSNASDAAGTSAAPKFPDPRNAWLAEGTFPRKEALRQVAAGVTKDQLYELLGRPHFSEGLYGVTEWDYLFQFRTQAGIRACQFKVNFDSNMQAQSMHWKPTDCAELMREPIAVASAPNAVAPVVAQVATTQPVLQPAPVVAAVPRKFELSADALFGFGRSDLSPEGRRQLDQVMAQLQGGQFTRVNISGHSDRIGSAATNERLSLARADSASDYMVRAGLPQQRIRTQGMGMSQPVVQCSTRARQALIDCLAPNRRVVIEVIGERS